MGDRVARGIRSFVENPLTNLVKGVMLLLIGITDASRTYREDVSHGRLQLGHGLILIGIFSVLTTLPHFIEGLSAEGQFLELRKKKIDAAKQSSTSE